MTVAQLPTIQAHEKFNEIYEVFIEGLTPQSPDLVNKLTSLSRTLKNQPHSTIPSAIPLQGTKHEEAIATVILSLMSPQIELIPTSLSKLEITVLKEITRFLNSISIQEVVGLVNYLNNLAGDFTLVRDVFGYFIAPRIEAPQKQVHPVFKFLNWEEYTIIRALDKAALTHLLPYDRIVGYCPRLKLPIVERITTQEYPHIVRVKYVEVQVKNHTSRRPVSFETLTETIPWPKNNISVHSLIKDPSFLIENDEYIFFGSFQQGLFYYYDKNNHKLYKIPATPVHIASTEREGVLRAVLQCRGCPVDMELFITPPVATAILPNLDPFDPNVVRAVKEVGASLGFK